MRVIGRLSPEQLEAFRARQLAPLPIAVPEEPEELGVLARLARGLKRSAAVALPETLSGALEFNDLPDFGLGDSAKARGALPQYQLFDDSAVSRGAEMAAPSLAPQLAAAGLIAALPIPTVLKGQLIQHLSPLTGAYIAASAQGQGALEQGLAANPNIDPELNRQQANKQAMGEFVGETAAGYGLQSLFKAGKRLIPRSGAPNVAELTGASSLAPFLKKFLENQAIQQVTEGGQAAYQTDVANKAGIATELDPLEAAIDVQGPTGVLGLLTGGVAGGVNAVQSGSRVKSSNVLADGEADPTARLEAARKLTDYLRESNPEAADKFQQNVLKAITNSEAISIDDSLFESSAPAPVETFSDFDAPAIKRALKEKTPTPADLTPEDLTPTDATEASAEPTAEVVEPAPEANKPEVAPEAPVAPKAPLPVSKRMAMTLRAAKARAAKQAATGGDLTEVVPHPIATEKFTIATVEEAGAIKKATPGYIPPEVETAPAPAAATTPAVEPESEVVELGELEPTPAATPAPAPVAAAPVVAPPAPKVEAAPAPVAPPVKPVAKEAAPTELAEDEVQINAPEDGQEVRQTRAEMLQDLLNSEEALPKTEALRKAKANSVAKSPHTVVYKHPSGEGFTLVSAQERDILEKLRKRDSGEDVVFSPSSKGELDTDNSVAQIFKAITSKKPKKASIRVYRYGSPGSDNRFFSTSEYAASLYGDAGSRGSGLKAFDLELESVLDLDNAENRKELIEIAKSSGVTFEKDKYGDLNATYEQNGFSEFLAMDQETLSGAQDLIYNDAIRKKLIDSGFDTVKVTPDNGEDGVEFAVLTESPVKSGRAKEVANFKQGRSKTSSISKISANLAKKLTSKGVKAGTASFSPSSKGELDTDNSVAQIFKAVTSNGRLNQYDTTITARTFPQVAKEMFGEDLIGIETLSDPTSSVGQRWKISWNDKVGNQVKRRVGFVTSSKDPETGTPSVWLDLASLKQGQKGSRAYQAALTYANNSGRTFIGDPGGVSKVAEDRRTRHMISSAARHQRTTHMEPSVGQGISGWDYFGDQGPNIEKLIKREVAIADLLLPSQNQVVYNFKSQKYEDGARGNQPVSDSDFAAYAEAAAKIAKARGSSTLGGSGFKAAALERAILREAGSGKGAELLAYLGGLRSSELRALQDSIGQVYYTKQSADKQQAVTRPSQPAPADQAKADQVGKAVVTDDYKPGGFRSVDATGPEGDAVKLLAKAFGIRIPGLDLSKTDADFNGAKLKGGSQPGVVFYNIAADRPLVTIAMHEMVHDMAEQQPAIYQRLRKFVVESTTPDQWLAFKAATNRSETGEALTEEGVADAMAWHSTQPGFLEAVDKAQKKAGGKDKLLDRLWDWIKSWFSRPWYKRVQEYAKDAPEAVQKHLGDLTSLRDSFIKAAADYSVATKTAEAIPSAPKAVYAGQAGTAPPFYSALTKAVSASQITKAPASQWLGTIRNMPGVKQEEVLWIGLPQWLKDQDGSVTKQQVLDYLNQANVNVEETVYGQAPVADKGKMKFKAMMYGNSVGVFDTDSEAKEAIREAAERSIKSRWEIVKTIEDEYSVRSSLGGKVLGTWQTKDKAREKINSLVGVAMANYGEVLESGSEDSSNRPKYSSYQLGGDRNNYRELVLTLPPAAPSNAKPISEKDADSLSGKLVKAGYDPLTQDQRKVLLRGGNEAYDMLSDFESRLGVDTDFLAAKIPTAFRTGHWNDVLNPLAHVRFNERTDKNGKRVLFIEEVQSDWHQRGREVGYKGPQQKSSEERLKDLTAELEKFAKDNGLQIASADDMAADLRGSPEYSKAATQESRDKVRVQLDFLADFIQRWDSIADGDLGQVPDAPFKKTWPLLIMKRMSHWASQNGYDRVAWTTGEQQSRRWGGREFKWFYDRDLVNMTNDFLKPFGATAKLERLQDYKGAEDIESNDMQFMDQWVFDVTPKMRETALQAGFPMFSKSTAKPSATTQQVVQDVKSLGNDWVDQAKTIGLGALGRRQLTDIYADTIPGLRQYNDTMQRFAADKNSVMSEADDITIKWGKLDKPVQAKLAAIMNEATVLQTDPAASLDTQAWADKSVHARLTQQFNQLPKEARDVYVQARDAYRKHWDSLQQALQDRVKRSELQENDRRRLLDQIRLNVTDKLRGVYFPLARFGKFYVKVTDRDTGETLAREHRETLSTAQEVRRQLLAEYPDADVTNVLRTQEFDAGGDNTPSAKFMAELGGLVDAKMSTEDAAGFKEAVNQLYLVSLPETSWAKRLLRRKSVAGYSDEARRAFAYNMTKGASYVARINYTDVLANQLNDLQKAVDKRVNDSNYDSAKAQAVINELRLRTANSLQPSTNPLTSVLTGAGFLWHMGLSPASAMINLSQTPLVAFPVLGSKFGFVSAAKELGSAMSLATKHKNKILSGLKGDELAAMTQAVKDGVVELTQAYDLASIADGTAEGPLGKVWDQTGKPVMRLASAMFHHAERFNRQTTFLAAYRLARQSGETAEAAAKTATQMTYDSHFDYSFDNRARWLQGNVARVILLFKQYAQNMVYTLVRSGTVGKGGFGLLSSDPKEREAAKLFASLLGMHAMAAGFLGLPVVNSLLSIASALGSSDDEPWDAKVALRNYLAEALGAKPAEVLMKGLPRVVPGFEGNLASRVGLDSLIFPDTQEALDNKSWIRDQLLWVLGPVAGIGDSMARGADLVGQGDYLRGTELLIPKAVRDPLKAWRYHAEGVRDKTGVEVVKDTKVAEELWQAIGMSPRRVAEAYEGIRAVRGQSEKLKQLRTEIIGQYAKADMADEPTDDQLDRVIAWNDLHPDRKITMQQLSQSVKRRQTRIDSAERGVVLSDDEREEVDELDMFARPAFEDLESDLDGLNSEDAAAYFQGLDAPKAAQLFEGLE